VYKPIAFHISDSPYFEFGFTGFQEIYPKLIMDDFFLQSPFSARIREQAIDCGFYVWHKLNFPTGKIDFVSSRGIEGRIINIGEAQ
jgi:hypothetical protein